jgi:hypothetical protein
MSLVSLTDRLIRMNDNYGYGDVLGVVVDEDFKGGEITVKRTSCRPETRRFRINLATNTVYFAGRQSCLNREFKPR